MQLVTAGIRRIKGFHVWILIGSTVEDDQSWSARDAANIQLEILELIENR
jgi:hypothetical protein